MADYAAEYDHEAMPATPQLGLKLTREELIRNNWRRYEYVRDRGHLLYCAESKVLEGQYLGSGLQWEQADREAADAHGIPAEEVNLIMPAINAMIGYQIANRLDISFAPRGRGADEETAKTLSKVAMQVSDNNKLHWIETEVFSDGLIQRRGYFDVRMSFDDNILGEISIASLDPRDVIPDPDAKSYDPDGWYDVTVTRFYTLDEIEWLYGADARAEVEANPYCSAEEDDERSTRTGRNRFGDDTFVSTDSRFDDGVSKPRYRVIDRQYWELVPSQVAVSPEGDLRVVDGLERDLVHGLVAAGWTLVRRTMKRVRWTVSTQGALLFDSYSPYDHFTVVPYFPFFRRGITRCPVDVAMSPQRVLNKAMSQFIRIANAVTNAGFAVQENSLTNMTTDELEERGGETGLVIEYKKGFEAPKRLEPPRIPEGMDRLIGLSAANVRDVTGYNGAMRGEQKTQESGIAAQARQFAAQQEWALQLDSLGRTRHMVADRIRECIQKYMSQERIIRITEVDAKTGENKSVPLTINSADELGNPLNDLTIGEYDVVVAEVPMQVTFQNSQFEQARDLKKDGAPIPWSFVLRYSNLSDKNDLIASMDQSPPPDPLTESKVALTKAQARKTLVEAVTKAVESQFSAAQTAQLIASIPEVAGLADALLNSAGFEDQNAAPIVPQPSALETAPAPTPMPHNTHPLFPANPDAGMMTGIGGGGDHLNGATVQ